MSSTFFGLNIGQTGLYAYQAALDTTAHNITNAETEGYSKQVMNQTAGKALPVNSAYGMAGTGVSVTGVTQLREEYYDLKYWKNNKLYGEYSNKSHYMTEVENYFNDINVDGFTNAFNSVYSSLQELNKDPANPTVRTQLINYAENLTDYFNSVSTNLKSIQSECNFEIRNQVDEVNSKSQQIAALTKQINTLEISGGTANDLRDQRALLVDQISQIANISVSEKKVGSVGSGVTSYVVKLDGVTLVDGGISNKLSVVPRTLNKNQNDVDGLYDIVWQNGQNFNSKSASLGGSLQSLFEVRDGNNQFVLNGSITASAGESTIKMTDTNINEVEKLNIPETGVLTVGDKDYEYTGFRVTTDADGKFEYEFSLKDPVAADVFEEHGSVGESINYKGIPYYMNQMNEFARTFSKAFNDIQRQGVDLNGDHGADFFSATNKINGRSYTFGPLEGSPDLAYYDSSTFDSQTGDYYSDVPDDQPMYGSYYFMTASNFSVNKDLVGNPNKMVTSTDVVNGSENNDLVSQMLALKDNKQMFKQGAPDAFFQTLVAEVGIDANKANTFSDSQSNILDSINNQRQSVSGVDVDEEAMNLVRYQNAYNLSAKVITIMNQVYDKLINYMGV